MTEIIKFTKSPSSITHNITINLDDIISTVDDHLPFDIDNADIDELKWWLRVISFLYFREVDKYVNSQD